MSGKIDFILIATLAALAMVAAQDSSAQSRSHMSAGHMTDHNHDAGHDTMTDHGNAMGHGKAMNHGSMMDHGNAMGHGHMAQQPGQGRLMPDGTAVADLPRVAGQGGFGALSEIVAMLLADPATDWSRVDITALRDHLVDMKRLMLDTTVTAESVPSGARFLIERSGPGGAAADRMVPPHAPVLAAETGWLSQVEIDSSQIIWTVSGVDETAGERIRALGFYGLMAVGEHHRAHHIALARGRAMH